VAWDPVAQARSVERNFFLLWKSGGVLTTGGKPLSFKAARMEWFAHTVQPMAKNFGSSMLETGIMAPARLPYLVGGVQYLMLMAGWGRRSRDHQSTGRRADQTPVLAAFLTFAIGGIAKLDVPRFRTSKDLRRLQSG